MSFSAPRRRSSLLGSDANRDDDRSALADLRPAKEDEARFRASRQREIATLNQLSAVRVEHVHADDDAIDDDNKSDESDDQLGVGGAVVDPALLVDNDDQGDFDNDEWEDGDDNVHNSTNTATTAAFDDDEEDAIEVTVDLSGKKSQQQQQSGSSSQAKPKRPAAPRRSKVDKDADLNQHRMHLMLMLAHIDLVDRAADDAALQAQLLSVLPAELIDRCTCNQLVMTEQQLLAGDAVNRPAASMLVPLVEHLRDHIDMVTFNFESNALASDFGAVNTSDMSNADGLWRALHNGIELHLSNHRDLTLVFCALVRALGWSCRVSYKALPHPLEPPKARAAKPAQSRARPRSAIVASAEELPTKRRRATPPVESKFFASSPVRPEPESAAEAPKRNQRRAATKPIPIVLDDDESDFVGKPKAKADDESVIEVSSDDDDDDDDEDAVVAEPPNAKINVDNEEEDEVVEVKRPRSRARRPKAAVAADAKPPYQSLYFCQVWCEAQCAWSTIDVVNGVWRYTPLERGPVPYIVTAQHGAVLDETQLFAPDWAAAHVLRVNADEDVQWLDDTLAEFARHPRAVAHLRDHAALVARQVAADDTTRRTAMASVPIPTRVTDFRRHPVYALGRFLTKFQAVHPSTTAGEFRGEPVFWRKNVHMLHTADKWLQEGRAPRAGEQPVKRVTARTRGGKGLPSVAIAQARLADEGNDRRDEPDGSATVGCFGRWQTELYRPPHVENGKVPRNSYGNVYLFKPEMLPVGGVHLRLPGVRAVASRLGIDAPPAQIGWDTHGGRSFPDLDGVVVAVESEQMLREAWQQAQEAKNERERKKRRARAVKNWKALCAAVVQRARIAEAYDSVGPRQQQEASTKQ
jgi:hypothetical protein